MGRKSVAPKWRTEMDASADPEVNEKVWRRPSGEWVYAGRLRGLRGGIQYTVTLGIGPEPDRLAMVRRRCLKALKKQLPEDTCKACGQKIFPKLLTAAQSNRIARLLGWA